MQKHKLFELKHTTPVYFLSVYWTANNK